MDESEVPCIPRTGENQGLGEHLWLQQQLTVGMDVIAGFSSLYFCPNGAYSFTQVSSLTVFLLAEISPVGQTHLNDHSFLSSEENLNIARTSWVKQSVKLCLPSDKRKSQHMYNWSGAPLVSKAALKPPWLKYMSSCFKRKLLTYLRVRITSGL